MKAFLLMEFHRANVYRKNLVMTPFIFLNLQQLGSKCPNVAVQRSCLVMFILINTQTAFFETLPTGNYSGSGGDFKKETETEIKLNWFVFLL